MSLILFFLIDHPKSVQGFNFYGGHGHRFHYVGHKNTPFSVGKLLVKNYNGSK